MISLWNNKKTNHFQQHWYSFTVENGDSSRWCTSLLHDLNLNIFFNIKDVDYPMSLPYQQYKNYAQDKNYTQYKNYAQYKNYGVITIMWATKFVKS